jgi:glycosyltransferase involved in cell wall biosynthesis
VPAAESIRVSAVMDTTIVSGPGRQLAAVAVALRDLRCDVQVITFRRRGRPPSPFAALLERAGVPHVVIPERGRFDVGVVARLRRAIDDWEPRIVQTHSYRPAALVAALRVRGARWPWVAFFHGTTREDRTVRFYNWLDRRLLRLADRIVVVSRTQLPGFASSKERVRVIHNAALDVPASIGDGDTALPADAARPTLGVVGRLSEEKGVDVLLEAMTLLRRDGFTGTALIAGDGPEAARLRARARALGLDGAVRFLGTVGDVASLYRALDLVVVPSRSEGMPNVVLEALRADRPIVATDVGGIPEILGDSGAGVLVPSGDAEALAAGIGRALAEGPGEPARRARRERADAFSLARRARDHRALYDDLLRTPADAA